MDHFPYQTGLLISYWDTSQADNNVNVHPGEGRNLYVDARPKTLYRLDGAAVAHPGPDLRRTVQPAQGRLVHPAPRRPGHVHPWPERGNPLFDDTKDYFDEALPNHGVKLPAVGVKIKVLEENGTSVKISVS